MREAERNCAARSRQRAIGVVNHERTSAAARDISKSRRKLGEGGGARRNGRGGSKASATATGKKERRWWWNRKGLDESGTRREFRIGSRPAIRRLILIVLPVWLAWGKCSDGAGLAGG